MKRVISLMLVLILMFTVAAPVFTASAVVEDKLVPIITLRGDGEDIYDASGEKIVWPVSLGDEEGDKEKLVDSVVDVIFPHLITGLLTGNYEGYYDAFYESVLPLFDEAQLDGNGNATNGSQLNPEKQASVLSNLRYDKKWWHGSVPQYKMFDYTFYYDWRLSPLETAQKLDEYIQGIMKVTGAKQVSLVGLCLGSCPVLAYLDLYNKKLQANPDMTPYIKNVMFDAGVANDCIPITDVFCGELDADADAIQRFLDEWFDPDDESFEGIYETIPFLNEVIFTTYELLRETYVVDALFGSVEDFYDVIYEGLVPKIAMASYANFPGYWACVNADRYEDAKKFMFADEELRQANAGLIAKIDAYYEQVSSRTDEIIAIAQNTGTHFGAVAKYGTTPMPITERHDIVSDRLVSLTGASFGATTATKLRGTLSDEYITERTALGYGEYISSDKKVDLSTSILKDTCWVIKNCDHNNWEHEEPIVEAFCWSTGMTTNNDSRWARFMYCDDKEENTFSEMTSDFTGPDRWEDTPVDTKDSTVWTKLAALIRWLTAMIKTFLHFNS